MPAPSAASARAMRSASRLRSARRTVPGPSASAARSSARLVADLEPGTRTTASTGPEAGGADHSCMHKILVVRQAVLMCGRYASARKRHELLEEFEVELDSEEELEPDYNVAPTKDVYAVMSRVPRVEGADRPVRQLRVVRWGLVPSWAKDPSIGSRLINARMETLAEKPAFRRAFASRRCLLPADGYYEWLPQNEKKNEKK